MQLRKLIFFYYKTDNKFYYTFRCNAVEVKEGIAEAKMKKIYTNILFNFFRSKRFLT